jgi:hypothetical protein
VAGTCASRISPGTQIGAGSILGRPHGVKVEIIERIGAPDTSSRNCRFRSSLGDDLGLRVETAICYQRQVFSCGQVGGVTAGVLQKKL